MLVPALAVAAAIGTIGCRNEAAPVAPPAPKVVEAEIPAGTKIPAMLMKQLESGIDDEGDDVPMVVTEDVKDAAGRVLITRGTPVQGQITWSRRESTLDPLINRPARLKFRFLATVAADGTAITVCADPAKPEEPYELNRANTGTTDAAKQLDDLAKDERNAQVLDAVTELFDKGDARLLEQEDSRERLASIAKELGLPELQSVAQQGQIGKVKGLLDGLRQGDTLARLAPAASQGPMTLMALMEMANVARHVNDRLSKITHGRNIKAYVGTPVTGYVSTATKVKVTLP